MTNSKKVAGIALASSCFTLGYVAQNVLAVYWTTSSLSPYGILLVNSASFPIIFGAMLAIAAFFMKDWRILLPASSWKQSSPFMWGSQMQWTMAVGFLNTLNGICIIFGSPANHTPPIIQAILQNSAAVFAVPFSILLLGDKRKYCSMWPLIATACIVVSVIVSILPTFIKGDAGADFNGGETAAWCLIYIAGLIPGAGYNVCQQRYLLMSGALHPSSSRSSVIVASLRVLFWGCLWMLISMACLFWVDMLPWFGTSTTLTEFDEITRFSLTCSFAGPSAIGNITENYPSLHSPVCDSSTPGFAYGFVLAYTVAYLGGAALNRESSTYTMLMFVLITILTSAFWFIPGTPGEKPTVWAVVISLVFSFAGMFVWKYWENKHEGDQFTVKMVEHEEGYVQLPMVDQSSVNIALQHHHYEPVKW